MKYEIIKTDTVKSWDGRTLYRIKRIETEERGGYIEKDGNLSQEGDAWVSGDARVFGAARVFGDAQVFGAAQVSGAAQVFGAARVSGAARVFGDAWVSGDARVFGDARVESCADYVSIGPVGSRNVFLTGTRDKDGNIILTTGCFLGSVKEFLAQVKKVHGKNAHGQQYTQSVKLIKLRLNK